ncbi:MAG TPA: alpha-ketoglutarate-dependent dioxygenase AlkB [Myxococcota bacterium]|nr:alpha-ketoglutarate-dependent dioxygenase AlkB [Myxococcota bacterium]
MLDEARQPSLFGTLDAPASPRVALDATSWLELLPGWLAEPAALFECLRTSARWEQRDRRMYERTVTEPRLTAELRDLRQAPAALRAAAERLSTQYGVRYDQLWLNFYRHGHDSTAWHGDRISVRREECIVPVLTLGATRRFLIKPRTGGASRAFWPESGDLVVMGGRCQSDWVHSVPKAPQVRGARISVNFQSSEQARPERRR